MARLAVFRACGSRVLCESSIRNMAGTKRDYKNSSPHSALLVDLYGVEKGGQASCMQTIGELLDQVMVDNPKSMRIFWPDKLVSNKLDAVFNHTGRNFQWDEFSNARGGRVIEILSEHTCQGMLQGYTLNGRTGLFPSYESFFGIIHTMMVQYSKMQQDGTFSNGVA